MGEHQGKCTAAQVWVQGLSARSDGSVATQAGAGARVSGLLHTTGTGGSAHVLGPYVHCVHRQLKRVCNAAMECPPPRPAHCYLGRKIRLLPSQKASAALRFILSQRVLLL